MKNEKYAMIFFCSRDQKHAEALKELLSNQGIGTLMAPYDIPAENEYAGFIDNAVRECACCIVILTDEAQQSQWMADAVSRILTYQKPLIPLSAEVIRQNYVYTFSEEKAQIGCTGSLDSDSEELNRLISAISKYLSEEDAEQETEIVVMGEYFYGIDGSTKPLKWIVLEDDGDRQLLLSAYVIDNTLYHKRGQVLSWKDCTLRKWLNTVFIEKAFSVSEASRFLETERTKTRNIFYDTEDSPHCSDKVFLLSVEEVKKYLGTREKTGCRPTPYAREKGVFTSEYCLWWIRTPGDCFGMQAYVNAAGEITYEGCYQQRFAVGLRPAVWVKKP